MRWVWTALLVTGCGDALDQVYVTVSRDSLSVEDVDPTCACHRRNLQPGECSGWSDVRGSACECIPPHHTPFRILRDGHELETGTYVREVSGDFSGATLVLDERGVSIPLPTEFPPRPVVSSATPAGVTWTIEPPTEALLTIGGIYAGQYCREPAGETASALAFYGSPEGGGVELLLSSELVTEPSPNVHIVMVSTARIGGGLP